MKKKRVIISVTNDLTTDQRVKRLCDTLFNEDYDIILIGRKLSSNISLIDRPYRTIQVKHWFNKGVCFYAEFNIRLFIFLLFTPFDILHSNDLDTLPANYLASRIKRKPVIYDSHEYFTGVPELINRHFAKQTWEIIENFIFPRLQYIITVNHSIARIYEEKYGKKLHVIRNLPVKTEIDNHSSPSVFGIPENKKLVILQGSGINRDRGAEEAVEAMQYVDDAILIIAGRGDIIADLKNKVVKSPLRDKVIFKPVMPYDKLINLTRLCDCGLSLDKDTNTNYMFSLPNKLFDYIMAEIPVIVSPLPEVVRIVNKYKIGLIIKNHSPYEIADKINAMLLSNVKKSFSGNLKKASADLNWDNEKHILLGIYNAVRLTY